MKERRRNPQYPSLATIWTRVWLAILVFAVILWLTYTPPVHSYDRDFYSTPYPGWHADMEKHERRQTELMERQEYRTQRRERQERADQNRDNWRAYQERLRRGGY